MVKSSWLLLGGAFLAAGFLLGCSDSSSTSDGAGGAKSEDKAAAPAAPAGFAISSTAFQAGQAIPKKYSYDGEGINPPLTWSGAAAGTKEFALIVEDPDAGNPPFIHWVVYGIPASATGLKEGLGGKEKLSDPAGAMQGIASGAGTPGYVGAGPPPGKAHHYHFRLYALGEALGAPAKLDRNGLLLAMKGKILAQTELVGTYARP